jgi:phosphopantetheinyl transferase (holo-ACP synthase)
VEIHWAVARDFESDSRRADWRAGRLAAKRAVAAALGVASLEHLEIDSRAESAPRPLFCISGERQPLDLVVSLAHDDGRAVAAVAAAARGARIGVDLEREQPLPAEHARYFLRAEERSATRASLLACWALKEAAWKALGLSRSEPLSSPELVWRGSELVALRHAGVEHAVYAELRRPWRGYLAALVVLPEAA